MADLNRRKRANAVSANARKSSQGSLSDDLKDKQQDHRRQHGEPDPRRRHKDRTPAVLLALDHQFVLLVNLSKVSPPPVRRSTD
jgi:hypothetical protein